MILEDRLSVIKATVEGFFQGSIANVKIGVIPLNPEHDEMIFKGQKPTSLLIQQSFPPEHLDREQEHEELEQLEDEEEDSMDQSLSGNFEVMDWNDYYIVVAGLAY